MVALHQATLHVVSIVITLMCAGISLLTWYRHRGGLGLRGWATALVLGGVGTFLYSLRDTGASFRVVVTADALFVAAFAAMWLSMRRFNEQPLAVGRMAGIVAAITALFVAFSALAWELGAAMRAPSVVFSVFIGTLALAAARATWQGRRVDGLRSRSIAALALLGIGVARLVRATIVVLAALGVFDGQTSAVTQGYTLYFTTVCILVVTFGLVLMANERFERQSARLADDRPAAD